MAMIQYMAQSHNKGIMANRRLTTTTTMLSFLPQQQVATVQQEASEAAAEAVAGTEERHEHREVHLMKAALDVTANIEAAVNHEIWQQRV